MENINWFKLVFAAALAVIFIVATLVALFATTRGANAVFRTYVFKVETCEFKAQPRPVNGDDGQAQEHRETCEIDYNGARRDIAEGLATLVVAAPLAWGSFVLTRRQAQGVKQKK